MSGEITRRRDGRDKQVRPTWAYTEPSRPEAEMLESIRNVLEEIKSSQMLQCDVAQAIKGMHEEARRTRLILARMDRRLAKVEKLK